MGHLLYEVSPPDLKVSQKASGCEVPFLAVMTPAEDPLPPRSVPNAHLGAHEYAFSMRASGLPFRSTLEPVKASSGAPHLYAHINHAFARAVTAFHVQPHQDCCGP